MTKRYNDDQRQKLHGYGPIPERRWRMPPGCRAAPELRQMLAKQQFLPRQGAAVIVDPYGMPVVREVGVKLNDNEVCFILR